MDTQIEDMEIVETGKKDKGFTLVELLIVIVILGILATVTVFAVRGITDKGQENSCDVELRSIETATEAYFANTGGDAPNMAALVGTYLKSDPSARWSLAAGSPPTISAVTTGACYVAPVVTTVP